jgi:hypothetical protein
VIEWEHIDAGLRVVDGAKTELVVDAVEWETGGESKPVDHRVDETVTGTVRELRLDYGFATLANLDTGRSVELSGRDRPFDLGDSEYLLNLDANIKTYVQFAGPATLVCSDDYEEMWLRFPEPAAVTLGFRSRLNAPEATVTVPETVEGVAAAVAYAASAHRTTSPDRSYATLRGHPPLVEYGDAVEVPDRVASATPDTGVEMRVPRSLRKLLVVAPLAYYLGATVTVEPGVAPQVVAREHDVRALLDDPDLLDTVSDTLERVFWLDCLVRNAGPHGIDLVETRLLDEVGVDADRAYDATPAERLRTYLDAPYRRIRGDLPDWHLSMHVAPTFENARTLPYLLDRLSLVYPPETEELEGRELMERSLDDFYRAVGPAPNIDVVKPKLRRGRFHGWLADRTPIDVFKALPKAFSNRFDYLERTGDDLSVAVVLNEATMEGEQSNVAEIYRDRSADLPLDVQLHSDLTRRELAAVFASENDFVHYIGHCEDTGLRCANGTLAVADIEESNTQTFFLNACGSYYEGMELIRKGSVAGAVTFRKVLDNQAAKVGSAFARLLVNGFSFERALRLARRRIMMGKDYGVVGDGTHVLGQSENVIPSTAEVSSLADGAYRVTFDAVIPHNPGGYYQPNVEEHYQSVLCGNEAEVYLSAAQLRSFFERAKMPVIYDGEFYWSTELAEKIV